MVTIVCNLVDQMPACFAWPMGTEPSETAGTAVIDAALQPMRDTLGTDGYALEWSMEQPNQVGIRVFATSDACEDCLVPPEIMRAIVSKALAETPYTVGSIDLPPKS
jgi:hypothetical protein